MIDWSQIIGWIISGGIGGAIVGTMFQHYSNKKLVKYNLVNESQFKAFSELWKSLIDLKRKADDLWIEANEKNLLNFVDSLKETDKVLEFNALILTEHDYNNLKEILKNFSEYRIGKNRLIDMDKGKIKVERRYGDIHGAITIYDERDNQIFQNENSKKRYESLIVDLRKKFQDKMGIK